MNKSNYRKNRRKEIWKERESNNLCIYCGKNYPSENKKGCENCLTDKSKKSIEYSKKNGDRVRQYNLLIKHTVIEKYGGKCACCGESQILFLTIDHKNNDGNIDRSENYESSGSFYLKLKRDPIRSDIQVLCFNCNMGKSINGGDCPHVKINRILLSVYDRRHDPQFDTRLKIVWPNDEELIKMCNETSTSEVAKKLGVNFSAVSGRLKRRNKYDLVNKKSGGKKMGEENAASKLKKENIMSIKEEHKKGISRKNLSKKYNVSTSLIDKIINGDVWKHL